MVLRSLPAMGRLTWSRKRWLSIMVMSELSSVQCACICYKMRTLSDCACAFVRPGNFSPFVISEMPLKPVDAFNALMETFIPQHLPLMLPQFLRQSCLKSWTRPRSLPCRLK